MATNRKRRGRGEGSVMWDAKKELWRVAASIGKDGTGKRKRVVRYAPTKATALELLRAMLTARDGNALTNPQAVTVGEFAKQWLDGLAGSVEPTTLAQYTGHVKNWIAPQLGGTKLRDLTPTRVSKFQGDMLAGKIGKPGGEPEPVSGATTKKVLVTLSAILTHAVNLGVTPSSPCAAVPKPKASRPVVSALTPDQAGKLLAAVEGDRLAALYALAIDSGLRQGELFALRWDDFDPAAGTLRVTKSLAELNGRLWVKDVKTANARRLVTLGFALPSLATHRERMATEGRDVATGLIFCDTEGGPLRKSNFDRRSFQPAVERAGITGVTFHGLRHSSASLLLLAGADTKVVSSRLGHGSAGFTMNTYQHVLPGLQAAAAELLKRVLTATPEIGHPMATQKGNSEGEPAA